MTPEKDKTPIEDEYKEKIPWLEKEKYYEDLIFKNLVIGYVVIQQRRQGKNKIHIYVTQRTIISSDDPEGEATANEDSSEFMELEDDENVVGVIPAPFPTYRVNAWNVSGTSYTLGYEHPGLPIPNWIGFIKRNWDMELYQE
jgi:hypothetical protein